MAASRRHAQLKIPRAACDFFILHFSFQLSKFQLYPTTPSPPTPYALSSLDFSFQLSAFSFTSSTFFRLFAKISCAPPPGCAFFFTKPMNPQVCCRENS